jgi:pimeloyl-ACP methyl ester carboxylesterase
MADQKNRFVEQHTTIGGLKANYIELDRIDRQSQNPIHIHAANGFPVGCYQSFIEPFTNRYHVTGLESRGMWPERGTPKKDSNWQLYADYLIEFLEQTNKRAGETQRFIGIGHSLGGSVTLIAALKRPDLFHKLVLIEPATTPSLFTSFVWQYLPRIAERSLSLVSRTLLRRKHWPNKAEFINYHNAKNAFKNCTTKAMQDYAEYGLQETPDNNYQLAYSTEWEAHNFRQVHYTLNLLAKVSMPTLLLAGATSYFYNAYASKQQLIEKHKYLSFQVLRNTGHLVPFENPTGAQKCILDWL